MLVAAKPIGVDFPVIVTNLDTPTPNASTPVIR
jgi:hypothetical protein